MCSNWKKKKLHVELAMYSNGENACKWKWKDDRRDKKKEIEASQEEKWKEQRTEEGMEKRN